MSEAPSLYPGDRLAGLPEGSIVYLVETMSEAQVLWAGGVPAFCAPLFFQSGKWQSLYTRQLAPFNVVVVPSVGYPSGGMFQAQSRVVALRKSSASVKLCPPPPCPGEGIADIQTYLMHKTIPEFVTWALEVAPVEMPSANGRPPAGDASEDHIRLFAVPVFPLEVLPTAARELVAYAVRQDIPAALTAGAALAALAAAAGPQAMIERPGWSQRAILWVPLVAPRGAGKSPAMGYALGPIREHDRWVWPGYQERLADWLKIPPKQRGEKSIDPTILFGDTTMEKLSDRLEEVGGAATLDLDELSQLLRGLGEYKRGGGGDRGRGLALWTGDPWRMSRVTRGDILIPTPTLVIAGGLQTGLHPLLGGDEDGLLEIINCAET